MTKLEQTGKSAHYRVGIATDPQPDDKSFPNLEIAVSAAWYRHDCEGWRTPVAVWNENEEIVWLFICHKQFKGV